MRILMPLMIATALALCPLLATARNYPEKPIRILATDPGGIFDVAARVIAQEITGPLGQPVIVENRPSNITPEILSRANPDGYTLAIGGSTVWLTQLVQKVPYDALRDFSPITMVHINPHVLVVLASLQVKTVSDLIALAKAKPGALNIAATASPGGASFLAAELFKSMAGVNLVRVPYKGNAQGLTALLNGESQVMFVDMSSVMMYVKAGKLNALAMDSLQPTPLAPGVPTVSASGLPGFESVSFAGMLAPAHTPTATIERLNHEIVRLLNRPDIKEKFFSMGGDVNPSTPAQFTAKIKSEMIKWEKVLRNAGVKAEP